MLKQSYNQIDTIVEQQTRKSSVWRDGALALIASLGVGLLAAALLTALVLVMTAAVAG